MTTTFDFGDGNGEVPAHRHINPDGSVGGWVAETCFVESTAYIGERSLVYEKGRVLDKAKIYDDAKIYGTAWISNHAQVFGNAEVFCNATVSGFAKIYGDAQFSNGAMAYGEFCKNITKTETAITLTETAITFDFGDDKQKMLEAAKNPKTSPDILDFLVKNSSVVIRTAAINNPNIRPSTLEDIATKTQGDSIIFAIATNTQASTESLAILLRREISRNTLASNPNTPIQLLIALAKSDCRSVFYNPNLPFETLEFLA